MNEFQWMIVIATILVAAGALSYFFSGKSGSGRRRQGLPMTLFLAAVILVGAALTFGSSSFVHAVQDDSLTLPVAVEHALEHHPDLEIARARVEQSAARAAALDSKQKVHLDAVTEQTVSEERHTVVPAVSFQSQKLDHLAFRSGTVGRLLLWDFGQTSKRVRSARQWRKHAARWSSPISPSTWPKVVIPPFDSGTIPTIHLCQLAPESDFFLSELARSVQVISRCGPKPDIV